jgi:hypothetical protein
MAALWERLSLSKKHTQDAVSSAGSSTIEKPRVDSGHGSPARHLPSSLQQLVASWQRGRTWSRQEIGTVFIGRCVCRTVMYMPFYVVYAIQALVDISRRDMIPRAKRRVLKGQHLHGELVP